MFKTYPRCFSRRVPLIHSLSHADVFSVNRSLISAAINTGEISNLKNSTLSNVLFCHTGLHVWDRPDKNIIWQNLRSTFA